MPTGTQHRTGRPTQRASHSRLMHPVLQAPPTATRTTRLNAIIVPAARRADRLRWMIELATQCQTTLVVLASHDCNARAVADLVAKVPGGRALVVDVPLHHDHAVLTLNTSDSLFHKLSAGRESNLSLKRNIGLLLAKLRGWRKVMFLDDDILGITPRTLARVAHHLENHRFAGLRTVAKEDNSVVCHANRLSGASQGIFVSGAALGVHTSDLPLDVFPDIYNEDWFAFAHEASGNGVGCAGDTGQLDFKPFEDPGRAAREEFGDVLAEGLYSLFSDSLDLSRATRGFWGQFIASRAELIQEIETRLKERAIWTHESVQAQASLARALTQLDKIQPDYCVDFVEAWRKDRDAFANASAGLPRGTSYADALDYLGLSEWQEAEFGTARVPSRSCLR